MNNIEQPQIPDFDEVPEPAVVREESEVPARQELAQVPEEVPTEHELAVNPEARVGFLEGVSQAWEVTMLNKRVLDKLKDDPATAEAIKAAHRVGINIGFATVDIGSSFIPGGSILQKPLALLTTSLKQFKKTDIAPDVPKLIMYIEALVDFFTCIPSYWYVARLQMKADMPRIQALIERAKVVVEEERRNYEQNKPGIDEAIQMFTGVKKVSKK